MKKAAKKSSSKSTKTKPYVIVRSREQGVMSGYLEKIDGRRVTLTKARQLWSWSSKFVLPDLAMFGPGSSNKFSAEAPRVDMLEACGVLYCSQAAEKAIRAEKAQER